MKKPLACTIIFFILTACCIASAWLYLSWVPVVNQDSGLTYYLRPGTSKKVFIADLSNQGVIQYPLLFSLYTYPQNNARLKTGEYFFPKGATLLSIWRQVTQGTGLVYHPFTIIPGWSFSQLRSALLQTEGLRHTSRDLTDKQIMARLGYPDLQPEGEFFPETYYYTRGISDVIILNRAFYLMQNKLTTAWQNRALYLPYKSAYEALIAASLIEKEAYLNTERPMIAGVLTNRLKKDMLLQFDPTVIYGLGKRYDGKIHKENLLDDNAYNTYMHKGLPPTPIAIPSLSSIEAAMHPKQHDYYYFVAKGDGSHQFSKTLPEHKTAVSTILEKKSALDAANLKKQTSYFNTLIIQKYLNPILITAFKKISRHYTLEQTFIAEERQRSTYYA